MPHRRKLINSLALLALTAVLGWLPATPVAEPVTTVASAADDLPGDLPGDLPPGWCEDCG